MNIKEIAYKFVVKRDAWGVMPIEHQVELLTEFAAELANENKPVDIDLRRDAELWRAHQKRKQDLIDRGFLRNPLRAAPQACLAEIVTIDAAMLSQGEQK